MKTVCSFWNIVVQAGIVETIWQDSCDI